MVLPNILKFDNFNNISTPKFHRRKDLTAERRFQIASLAYDAQLSQDYGAITDIAKKFNVCRDTVYNFLKPFKKSMIQIFSPSQKKRA